MVVDASMTDRHAYPRPTMERPDWINLNGWWDFAIDSDAQWTKPEQVEWDRRILVPFSPETKLSGVGHAPFSRVVWYKREVEMPELSGRDGQGGGARGGGSRRLILHFGAVDYAATVWVNGLLATRHEGG